MSAATGRPRSRTGRLARLGFTDAERAGRLLADPVLRPLLDPSSGEADEELLTALGATADPELALLGLLRLLEACGQDRDLARVLRDGGAVRDRLLAVLGASAALADHLSRHPEHWRVLEDDTATPADPRTDLLLAVGADPQAAEPVAAAAGQPGYDLMRTAYRRRLLALAGRDLTAADPVAVVDDVAAALADLAAAALEAGLALARAELGEDARDARLAVVAMGKTGGRELNYVSDVDVVYVAEPADGVEEERALEVAARLATGMARACSGPTGEGALWPVDAALRPEGRNGPLVRTLASHVAYYERWARTWEFQALLKARPVAGDADLGRAYVEAITPMVWRAAERDGFVADVQAMRRRVEEHVPSQQADRQLKLGAGGLRDVEFTVQLLQLVHGRTDDRLRSGNTLEALEALSRTGYVGRDDAADLDLAYRWLRVLEHRLQLHRLRRTHLLPTGREELRRLARACGLRDADTLERQWQQTRREVRRLHERLFYRPLLAAAARLSTDEVRLTPEAARSRLQALGYVDPAGALHHLTALTEGVSRRAAIQRQLLPVLLGWFADGADPDAGLLAFRRVSDELGTTHWYLKMLRDSGAAAERLAHVLSGSRLVAELLEKEAEATRWLGSDESLRPPGREALLTEARTAADRQQDPGAAVAVARGIRTREVLRTAIADVVGLLDDDAVAEALTDATVVALDVGLRAAVRVVEERTAGPLPTSVSVVGMGRLGGGELGYGSDADVVVVHRPLPGAPEALAQEAAVATVTELQRLLTAAGPDLPVGIDTGLRPEGRNGPVARTLDSYAEYYRRWAQPWERQALLRAVPVAGDEALAGAFTELVDPLRYPVGGLDAAAVREIRRVKARVERERIPRGRDPRRHLKLGPGGLADVEWVAQLLQLRHAAAVPALRTPSTTAALAAASAAALLDPDDAAVLTEAWRSASRIRNAAALWRGRPTDVLPESRRDLEGVARLLGYPPGAAADLEEDHLRRARRARAVMERVFYG
ncbi:bifunctional [glutamine synthetase] adenylyltransferase/[glutamine synthetase]-adenylyl-L-tyrosine phosphorylase [Quadrisphaera sp. GCM10027208]|uniref:bifunctional [glutamine synthetase] adenylyltransferase/[glutamine synthetase]-adenylyl-L-tyrosine phosphorylase n=1 Tax=Quadrisphaera sp. GCM10027208 TaxID=3273423 RepID=UPI003607B11D